MDNGPRQHGPAFDFKQCGGNHQEITGFIHVQVRGIPDDFQILIGDFADKDIPDINLRFSDQRQEQVQRTVKILQPEFPCNHLVSNSSFTEFSRKDSGRKRTRFR